MKQLRIGDVARVTGVRDVQLLRWLDRHTIQPSKFDKSTTGTGDFRTFSRATVNKIAIAKNAINLGVPAGPANAAAAHFTESGDKGRPANELYKFGLTVLIHTASGTTIKNVDSESSLADVFGRNFEPTIILNVGPIIKAVDEKLNSLKKDTK
jgi:DNA-binding transcriptional MerR regulator